MGPIGLLLGCNEFVKGPSGLLLGPRVPIVGSTGLLLDNYWVIVYL